MNKTTIDNSDLSKPVDQKTSEWRFVIITIIFVLVITTIPYVYAYLSTPADKQFMGIMLNVPDHVQYFSWMRELTHAHLSANKLTPEVNQPVFFNLLWWSMGRLSYLFNVNYAFMFQVLRVIGIVLFLLLAYKVCSRFLTDLWMRRTAFLLITFAAGFGWILVALKYTVMQGKLLFPLLVYISEPNTFLNMLAFPHFISAALYIFVFELFLQGETRQQLRYGVIAGLVALFLGWQHAYDLMLVYGILGTYILLKTLRDRQLPLYLIKSMFILGIISWWPALYSVLLTSLDPLWKEVLAQFANAGVFTPNPLGLIILLGPTFILALFTFFKENPFRLQGLTDNALFLKGWFVANFLLIYVPTDYQIHMLNGWQVPMAILATQALFYYIMPWIEKLARRRQWSWSKQSIQRGVIIVLLAIVLPTNIYLFFWRFIDLSRHDYPYYLHTDELAALTWLETNAASDDVVLSSLTIGQYIPALTGTNAFLAHWAQTADYFGKVNMVDEFFSGKTDENRRQEILQQYSVDYIFYGQVEKNSGNYNPNSSLHLVKIFSENNVDVYKVQNMD